MESSIWLVRLAKGSKFGIFLTVSDQNENCYACIVSHPGQSYVIIFTTIYSAPKWQQEVTLFLAMYFNHKLKRFSLYVTSNVGCVYCTQMMKSHQNVFITQWVWPQMTAKVFLHQENIYLSWRVYHVFMVLINFNEFLYHHP